MMNEMIERKKKNGRPLYLGFLHTENTYDRVNREVLCTVLEIVRKFVCLDSVNHQEHVCEHESQVQVRSAGDRVGEE